MVAATWLSADLPDMGFPGVLAKPHCHGNGVFTWDHGGTCRTIRIDHSGQVHGGFLRAAELLDRTAVSCRIVAPIGFTLCFQLQH